MGFIWSKPSPLRESLLPDGPTVLCRIGDLLLVPYSDLEVTLNTEPWKHVALFVSTSKLFLHGQLVSTNLLFDEHDILCMRQLNCERPLGFEKKFVNAVAASMSKSYDQAPEYRDGFEIAYVLYLMGFIKEENIHELHAGHFSNEMPYKKLQLDMYSENVYL